jgi:general secretion pathway protein J
MRRRSAPGFTLIELVLALSIVAIMVTMLFGGLRVGLRAWQRGEERATALQHSRSMRRLLEDALAGTYWYLGKTDQNDASPVLLFKGETDRLSFVTVSPPMPPPASIPFVAVTLSMDAGSAPGLVIREKALPNFDPFEEVAPSVLDPTIASIGFRYLRPGGDWEDAWDSADERALPQAVEVTVTPAAEGQRDQPQPIVIMVPIRVNAL